MLARYAGPDRPVDASRRASRVVRPSIRSFATYFSKEHEFIDVCWVCSPSEAIPSVVHPR